MPLVCAPAGETLSDEKAPVILERMDFPDPVIKIAIEPKSKADLEKMGVGLNKLAQEDPSFGYSRDEETGQTVSSGQSGGTTLIIVRHPQVAITECGAIQRGVVESKGSIHVSHWSSSSALS
jgi:hypothetical protein